MSGTREGGRRGRERAIELVLRGCGIASTLVIVALMVVVIGGAAASPGERIATATIFTLIGGTAMIAAMALLVALPAGLLAAIYLAELAPARTSRWLEPSLAGLSQLPTVIFGYLALAFVTPTLQRIAPGLAAHNALSAGLVTGIMLTPLISGRALRAIRGVPAILRESAWALGASEGRALRLVVLPAVWPSLAGAALLGLSRAVGETMIVALAAGASPGLDPRGSVETLSAFLIHESWSLEPGVSTAPRPLLLVAAILLLATLAIDSLGRRVEARGQEAPR